MKVVFLDRDNTLNYDPGYIADPDQLQLKDGVIKGLQLLKSFGYKFIILTNQSGVGRGFSNEKQLSAVHKRLKQILKQDKINILDIFYCPHVDSDRCDCRKPKDGLLRQALKKYPQIDLSQSYIVGDRLRDLLPQSKYSLRGVLIEEKLQPPSKHILYQAKNFLQACSFILQFDYDLTVKERFFENHNSSKFNTILNELKQKHKKLIFTNGCFDILHSGHIQYLDQAKSLGDILVVGVNSDSSVKKLKGESRPINDVYARAKQLLALKSVDYVVQFGEETPVATLKKVQPNIHVKGGDYVAEEMVEYPTVKKHGGKVMILPFLDGFSTTSIIEKIYKGSSKKEKTNSLPL